MGDGGVVVVPLARSVSDASMSEATPYKPPRPSTDMDIPSGIVGSAESASRP